MPLVHSFKTPPDIMTALQHFGHLPGCLLMESSRLLDAQNGKPLGRYSFLMADPIENFRCDRISDASTVLGRIDAAVEQFSATRIAELPPMQGGVAGLFSYDLNRAFERLPEPAIDEFKTPLISVGVYDVVLAWDHKSNSAWMISHGIKNDAAARRDFFLGLLRTGPAQTTASQSNSTIERESLAKQNSVAGPEGLTSNLSRDQYLAAIKKSIDYINAGDIFQVNFAQRLLVEANCDSIELYRRLRDCNPAPFGGYYDFGGNGFGAGQLISASPERLVSIRDGLVETRPIKGTRVRTGQPMVDLHHQEKLASSEKDRAENTMIVDLMRNDLSRICTDNSVKVTQLCQIENYQSVMHLVSAVEGQLKDRCRPSELLAAVFPGGSITGAPKVRAMEIIAELEPTARGAYCGSLGYFGFDGSVDLNILIRTVTASGGWWQIPVGGGIVTQSRPASEYKETWTKAAGLLSACLGQMAKVEPS